MATVNFPHFFRIFSRMIIVLAITSAFSLFVMNPNLVDNLGTIPQAVKGVKTDGANLNLQGSVSVEEVLNYLSLKPNDPYALALLEKLSTNNSSKIQDEIVKTEEIVKRRPDYASAWFRLSILYTQIGRDDLSKQALEQAKKLNWEF